ncbi:MAG: alcohol dehydrogenase catalytic domain-containing protein [Nocardioidaceae bacterium]|nr:alcohol dehydrogenase catalytic domain-containing protein [Nocardioidaceae bacterium]NUS52219.1 alcohol dehydrogenase catalytic domain-containing protein [Nocardioidaceae bacterium]
MGTEPAPGPAPEGWSRVAVTSVGICGSDLHWFVEGGIGETGISDPVVPGHEFAGVVREGPLAGRRVAVDPAIPCGTCEQCRAGHGNLCRTVRFAGHGDLDGALQQELLWPDHLLHPLPDQISDDAGALLEPLGVAIHAVGMAHVALGDDVLVVGGGPIGVLSAYVARRAGARRVWVVEPLAHRRTTALRYGAEAAWAPADAVDALEEATAGRGADTVVEMAGTDDAITIAVAGAAAGARVALGGIPSQPRSSFPASEARRKGLTFAMVRRMHETYGRAIALATSGLDLDGLVTARFPLTDAADGFTAAAERAGDKTVVAVS